MKDTDTLLDVLIYLLTNYAGIEVPISEVTIKNELTAAGFDAEDIVRAFGWIDSFSEYVESDDSHIRTPDSGSMRLYSEEEKQHIGVSGLDFLAKLVSNDSIDSGELERLLDILMTIDIDSMNDNQLKRLILLLLVEEDHAYDYYALDDGISLDKLDSMIH